MARHILSIVMFLLSAQLAAQVITVSNEISLRAEYVYDILGQIDEQVILIRDGINGFDLQAFDQNLRQTWEREEKLDSRKAASLISSSAVTILRSSIPMRLKTPS